MRVFAFLAWLGFAAVASAQAPPEAIAEVRVHGNHTTPDADILAIAGLVAGGPASEATLSAAEERLRASGRFESVEVRRRYHSIANPSAILVIILVNEVAAVSVDDLTPGPMKKVADAGMWLPVLRYDDGYGFTYGARISFVESLGTNGRLSVPLTWGGERQVALEADRTFERGPITRVEAALSWRRRENPHFELADTRREARVRAERAFAPWLRAGGGLRVASVAFGAANDTATAAGVDVTVDTRLNPSFPRDAVFATARWERLGFDLSPDTSRWTADARGYVGLWGPSVLALRGTVDAARDPLPRYERALLGGPSTVRGYPTGHRAGDRLAAASAELRVPLTSPLNVGLFGVKAFVDLGTVWGADESLRDRRFDRGIGGGAFVTAAFLTAGLDVAWPREGKPRWQFGLGMTW